MTDNQKNTRVGTYFPHELQGEDPVDLIAVMQQYESEMKRRRRAVIHQQAIVCLKAVLNGYPLEKIMEAAGFLRPGTSTSTTDSPDDYMQAMQMAAQQLGLGGMMFVGPQDDMSSAKTRFHHWLSEELKVIILGEEAEDL